MAKINLGEWDITSNSSDGTMTISSPNTGDEHVSIADSGLVKITDSDFAAPNTVTLGEGGGLNGLRIKSDGESPSRRGITLPSDPEGQLRLWIHSYQKDAQVEIWDGADNSRVAVIDENGNMRISGSLSENESL